MRRLLLLLLAAGCTDPSVVTGEAALSTVSGSVLVQAPPTSSGCVDAEARGPVMLFLFDADDPPPPAGTGSPVSFVLVPEEALFPAGARVPPGALLRADYVFPNVAPGRYLVTGFLDADGDFNPTVPTLAQPTAGDLLGGRVDDAGRPEPIEVPAASSVEQVTVRIGRPVPFERPVFRVATSSLAAPAGAPARLRLEAVALEALAMRSECVGFLVASRGVGGPVDANRDGLEDLYPRVLLTRLEPEDGGTVAVEAALDPLPFRDALALGARTSTPALELILPPGHAILRDGEPPEVRPGLPAGRYAVNVISASGQTWTVPNALAASLPGAQVPPAQAEPLNIFTGPEGPGGRIEGEVLLPASATEATVWVVAFSASDPPPPLGTGGPVAVSSAGPIGQVERRFRLGGLPDGGYLLVALADLDGTAAGGAPATSFSPLVPLLAEPSAGDLLARPATPVEVRGGGLAAAPRIELPAAPIGFPRPVFGFDGPTRLDVSRLPAPLRLVGRPAPALGVTAPARFPVTRSPVELDGLPPDDVLPRALLVRLADGGPALARDPRGLVVPAWVSPVPFLGRLPGPGSVVAADALDMLVLPTAFRAGAQGLEPFGPPPDGRYQLVLLSPTGQSWQVPNGQRAALGRPPERGSERVVELFGAADRPPGGIEGQVQLAVAPPAERFTVVVAAYALDAPPPPRGRGRPRAVALLSPEAFAGGRTAPYRLEGLAAGRYTVTAILDADADFAPWISVLAQPDAGDVIGGAFDGMGRPRTIEVAASGRASAEVAVTGAGLLPVSPPTFRFRGPPPVLSAGTSSAARAELVLLDLSTPLGPIRGDLNVQWADLDGDGRADDANGDGRPDVFPLVFAELLTDEGEPDPAGWRIPGTVDPRAFAGFPAGDPTDVAARVSARALPVTFFPAAVRGDSSVPASPPPGRWRVTVVAGTGQVWFVPNALGGALGTPLEATQGAALTVAP